MARGEWRLWGLTTWAQILMNLTHDLASLCLSFLSQERGVVIPASYNLPELGELSPVKCLLTCTW